MLRKSILCFFLVSSVSAASTCSDRDEVTVQSMMPVSNGCSKPPGMSVDGEEDFTYCCDRHDACYQTCGMDKKYCESDFGQCMKAMCVGNFAENPGCKGAAELYKLGVSMFGGAPFQNMQDDACECVGKDSIGGRYRKWFREIYKSSGLEDEEVEGKVAKLIEKMEHSKDGVEARDMGRDTFYKLLKKYDDAIIKVDKRVKMNPPRLKKKKKKKNDKKKKDKEGGKVEL
mmetsp:Transcript_6320/g.12480  ORF Transcript_6320/g.12480 Transcript_6320/m.12480 type:complete len:229 (+) Transcript_6320:83-769(+)